MRVNRSLLGWGLFFVVAGAVALAVRQGVIDEDTASRAWTLWPILLVLGGLGLVLRRSRVEPLTGMATAATFGVIVGGVFASGTVPLASCGDSGASRAFAPQSGDIGGARTVELELSCGELTVATAAGTGWSLGGVDEDGRGPRVEASGDELSIRGPDVGNVLGARAQWQVTLPQAVEIDVDAQLNAGTARFDLDGAQLALLKLTVNAGGATLDLRGVAALRELDVQFNAVGNPQILLPERSISGSIEGNAAGGIRLCPPRGAGLRLTPSDSVAASHNYAERGLVRDGDAWETPGYDAASARIDLRTEVTAGSFVLEPEATCDA